MVDEDTLEELEEMDESARKDVERMAELFNVDEGDVLRIVNDTMEISKSPEYPDWSTAIRESIRRCEEDYDKNCAMLFMFTIGAEYGLYTSMQSMDLEGMAKQITNSLQNAGIDAEISGIRVVQMDDDDRKKKGDDDDEEDGERVGSYIR